MPLPPKTAPVWQKLANGGLKLLSSSNLGMQMLTQRIEMSKLAPAQKLDEIYAFFVKWERGLSNEVAQLGRL